MQDAQNDRDLLFMKRAMELALNGLGFVSPNPLVGCVVVHDDKIISESWHKRFGGPHAEVNAIEETKDKALLKECTLFINLEPCSHFGKTPPCVDLLLEHRLKRVVISNLDSNPLVAGEGVNKLTTHGIQVDIGILEKEGRELNRRFFTYMEKLRPFILLKWAETADGFIAGHSEDRWISNEHSQKLVHKWRTEEDAILVGTHTAAKDNPMLNVRHWKGRNPVRVVIDRSLKLARDLNLFDGTQKTICYNTEKSESSENLTFVQVDPEDFISDLIRDLGNREIQSLIVEGGAYTLQQFINAGLWDEARVFTASKQFGRGVQGPTLRGKLIGEEEVSGDRLKTYRPFEKKNHLAWSDP